MRRARSRRERRAREAQAVQRRRVVATIAMVALVAIGIALPGVLIWRFLSAPDVRVDASGCAVATAPPRHVVIVIDQTDALPPPWRAFVRQLIPAVAAAESFPTYGKLTVLGLTANIESPLEEILSECRPPEPDGGSVLFNTRAEREARQERFDAFYDERIQAAVGRAENAGPREASPLLEAFVALQDRLIEEDAGETELIIISDMMQFTRAFSHYGGYSSYDDFVATARGGRLTAALRADALTAYYVRRPELADRQDAVHRDFWSDYFVASGGLTPRWVSDPLAALAALE